jgi:hypothetical protein
MEEDPVDDVDLMPLTTTVNEDPASPNPINELREVNLEEVDTEYDRKIFKLEVVRSLYILY